MWVDSGNSDQEAAISAADRGVSGPAKATAYTACTSLRRLGAAGRTGVSWCTRGTSCAKGLTAARMRTRASPLSGPLVWTRFQICTRCQLGQRPAQIFFQPREGQFRILAAGDQHIMPAHRPKIGDQRLTQCPQAALGTIADNRLANLSAGGEPKADSPVCAHIGSRLQNERLGYPAPSTASNRQKLRPGFQTNDRASADSTSCISTSWIRDDTVPNGLATRNITISGINSHVATPFGRDTPFGRGTRPCRSAYHPIPCLCLSGLYTEKPAPDGTGFLTCWYQHGCTIAHCSARRGYLHGQNLRGCRKVSSGVQALCFSPKALCRQTLAPFAATRINDAATSRCRHARTEAMTALAHDIAWLECTFHRFSPTADAQITGLLMIAHREISAAVYTQLPVCCQSLLLLYTARPVVFGARS